MHKIAVMPLKLRQVGRYTGSLGSVQRLELIKQQRVRPEIARDVMQRQQKHVLMLRAREQADAESRSVLQIEWAARFHDQLLVELLPAQPAGIAQLKGDLAMCKDLLYWPNVLARIGGAQRRMPIGERLKRTLHSCSIKRGTDTSSEENRVGPAVGREPVDKPQGALVIRKRKG